MTIFQKDNREHMHFRGVFLARRAPRPKTLTCITRKHRRRLWEPHSDARSPKIGKRPCIYQCLLHFPLPRKFDFADPIFLTSIRLCTEIIKMYSYVGLLLFEL